MTERVTKAVMIDAKSCEVKGQLGAAKLRIWYIKKRFLYGGYIRLSFITKRLEFSGILKEHFQTISVQKVLKSK